MTLRVLHVDDEPDIREVVEMSLGLDPGLALRSVSSGNAALTEVGPWAPDLILLDVMMPVMDGPATLARLRETPEAAGIPVVFMTARAQTRELEHFRSLGAAGVIAKPFDPMTLAVSVRSYLKATKLNGLRASFLERAKADAAVLSRQRARLDDPENGTALQAIKSIAHGLAGASGIYGLDAMGREAAEVEAAADDVIAGGDRGPLDATLDRLLACIADS
jgi:CheY-like chemotaxis protein